jgi:rhodanese-related sulfurtransferase
MERMKFRIFILSVFVFSAIGCATSNEIVENKSERSSAVKEISPKQAASEIAGGVQLIDVRSESEFEAYHIDGSKNIPIDEFDSAISTFDKTKPVYLVCEVGLRSTTAARKLVEAGFSDVRHIEGGLRAWEKEGLLVKEGK